MKAVGIGEDLSNNVTTRSPDADYLLTVDVKGGKSYAVILCDLAARETLKLGGLDEALLWMDRQMDQRRHPRADTVRHSYDLKDVERRRAEREATHLAWLAGESDPYIPKTPPSAEELPNLPKGAAVFHIQILYRWNSSWQGDVTYWRSDVPRMRRKHTKKTRFRSVLELLYIIRSALPDGIPSPEGRDASEKGAAT